MICTKCGKELHDEASFCGGCGEPQLPANNTIPDKKFKKDKKEKNDKPKFSPLHDDETPHIIITPAKKAEIIENVKRFAVIAGCIFGVIVAIFIYIYLNASYDYKIDNNVLVDYNGTNYAINIPNKVTEIGSWAFADKRFIKTITISESVNRISIGAFEGCTSLTIITIPETVTDIGDWAFAECWSLTTVCVKAGSYADAWARTYDFHSDVTIEYY